MCAPVAYPPPPGAAYAAGPYAHAPAAALYPPPPPPPAPPTSQQGAAAAQQLQLFWAWAEQYREIEATTDFKPAPRPDQEADEDVRMIAAEAPVVFARACEMFHLARGKGSQDRNRAMASASAPRKPTRTAEKIGKRNNLTRRGRTSAPISCRQFVPRTGHGRSINARLAEYGPWLLEVCWQNMFVFPGA